MRPNPGPHVLERQRLLEALAEHADRPLTLLVAEAGYGKTTVLAEYLRTVRRPVVWYSLMPSDADLVLFCRYLLTGLRRVVPRWGRAFERALDETRPGGRSTEMLAGTLVNELATVRGPRILLVLDDFQEVVSQPQVTAFVGTLLRRLPDTLRLVIASRIMPPLPLDRMRASGEVYELNSDQLRLTREDLARLFEDVYRYPLSEKELADLEETTLGWPTAVHLVHESLQRSERSSLDDVLQNFRASDLGLHDYLSSEVYAHLDAMTRRLLERTAALVRFDSSLATRLTGYRDTRPALEALARRGLLRSYGLGEQTSFECHELVRRFVRHEIEARLGADGWRTLEAEAAAALAERGELEPALLHFLAAGRSLEAAALLRDVAPAMLRQGRAAAVRQFVGELPAAVLRDDPELILAMADAQQALGAWDEAEARYSESPGSLSTVPESRKAAPDTTSRYRGWTTSSPAKADQVPPTGSSPRVRVSARIPRGEIPRCLKARKFCPPWKYRS